MQPIDIVGPQTRCGPDCPRFIERWTPWWERQLRGRSAALLEVVEWKAYLNEIGSKSRNMVRKADQLYTYRPFLRNSWLDDIYAINTSKPVRAGGPMTANYLARPGPDRSVPDQLCRCHGVTWQGGFSRRDGRLVTYCNLIILNELAVVNTILGHADAPASVNGLIAYMVGKCRADWPSVRWIHYLTVRSSPEGLARFKLSVGFREVALT